MSTEPDPVAFDGPCPFLTCPATGAHQHEVCSRCEAVRHGNPFGCEECAAVWNAIRAAEGLDQLPTPGGA